MALRFSLKRCTVDELLQSYRPMLDEIAKGEDFPALNFVAQQYRELEAQQSALVSLLMDGAEAVGFLVTRKAGKDQGHTAVLDIAAAREELKADWMHELSALTFVEAQYMAREMGATGLRIPCAFSGPASAAVTGVEATGTGTAYFEAFR